ncbi:EAL domain-containing protein [Rhodobium gokarnense]|uniref:Cyclic-di-GMP phosphodiesterase TipF (Flagellum assembly factor) n=1 Tax=Rhodobium gokarnense TaxID=364296 RepID=A0ABT3HCM7_9HYPH|nr:EAL domain-containing protein [Rhodobium gokarnense]MCW2308154.1 cyclic-di-GMP phosphodiesterase TipF (flagellum assembly factor) [Rhodobium gokarnense]
MARIIAVFVFVCMVVIAGSVGVIAHLQLGAEIGEALLLSAAVMLVVVMLQAESQRRRERRIVASRFDEILENFEATADEITNVERRLVKLEAETQPERSNQIDSLLAEVEVLGAIVKQMAEQLTESEARIAELEERERQAAAPPPVAMIPSRDAPAREVRGPARDEEAEERAALAEEEAEAAARRKESARLDAERRRLVAAVRSALDNDRIELHMQPIVSLPQRQVRFYEVLTRLIEEDGSYLYPETFLHAAESAGQMPRIDRFVLQNASRIARRLTQRNRGLGLFCNLSGTSLVDEQFLGEFERFLEINKDLARSMVFELRQESLRAMGPLELEGLTFLRDLGCRFSLDRVRDLHIDFADLSARGFRFVKLPAGRLLDEDTPPRADIHVADIADLASRHGIEIVADTVEREAQVIGLLDFKLRYGQGAVFAHPKPVRPEVLASLSPPDGTSQPAPTTPPPAPSLAKTRRRAAG